jgi:hypothetical protein
MDGAAAGDFVRSENGNSEDNRRVTMTTAQTRQEKTSQLFKLGRTLCTPAAQQSLIDAGIPEDGVLGCFHHILTRHLSGDWGECCDEDKATNDQAVKSGARILSVYTVSGVKLWVITEADRSYTTILLPEDY